MMAAMAARVAWSRDELLGAFRLYCRRPFGKLHQRNPEIIALGRVLGRTPSAARTGRTRRHGDGGTRRKGTGPGDAGRIHIAAAVLAARREACIRSMAPARSHESCSSMDSVIQEAASSGSGDDTTISSP